MSKVVEVFGCNVAVANELHNSDKFTVGVECEVEAVLSPGKCEEYGFQSKADNSLRNHGVEFVSVPMTKEDFLTNFGQLYKTVKLGEEPFSQRTSTHVHVNISSMDMKHARNMVLLYALFEEAFFMMVKPERRENIHCVPLTETHLPSVYKLGLDKYVAKWSKYTALNLKRVPDLGTLEFRHMHGTKDVGEMKQWLDVLENLWQLAQKIELNGNTLKEKNILLWFETIFKDVPNVLQLRPTLFDVIRNNLIDVKFSI